MAPFILVILTVVTATAGNVTGGVAATTAQSQIPMMSMAACQAAAVQAKSDLATGDETIITTCLATGAQVAVQSAK